MALKKRALGRGLDSLIVPEEAPPEAAADSMIVEIPIEELHPNINQPRTRFEQEQLAELAESIRSVGIMQPLVVRRRDDGYELIAGERRYRAAQLAGLEKVPCRVMDVSDEKSFEMALIENLQREDLNAMEESRAYQSLVEQFGLTQEDVAARVGRNRSTVANSLRLLQLPLDIQEDILAERLTSGHARAVLAAGDTVRQRHLRNIILARGLSVREAEALARRMNQARKPKPPVPTDLNVQMRSLQEELSMKVGLPVFIKAVSAEAGKLEIQYHSLDDFDILMNFFGVERT